MSAKMDPACYFAPDWIDALLEEYIKEVREEAIWPILLLQSSSRKLVWYLSSLFGLNNKGIPGNACRLMERYLSCHLREYLKIDRATNEWQQYRPVLQSKYYLIAVSCIQLAAKMAEISPQLTASLVRSTLLREGIINSKKEIIDMEFHVYQTIGFRIPLWNALEMAEFFAVHVGIRAPRTMQALAYIVNISEFHRNVLEIRMRCWNNMVEVPEPSPSDIYRASLHTLHISAGCVCAAAKLMRNTTDLVPSLAAITRTTPAFINAIMDIILKHVLTGN